MEFAIGKFVILVTLKKCIPKRESSKILSKFAFKSVILLAKIISKYYSEAYMQ